jgi:hypothetical protein
VSSDDGVVEEPHERGDLRLVHGQTPDGISTAGRRVDDARVDDEEFAVVAHSFVSGVGGLVAGEAKVAATDG